MIFSWVRRGLRTGVLTTRYPAIHEQMPEGFRGKPAFDAKRCLADQGAASARAGSHDLLVVGATGNAHPLSPTTGGTARKVANQAPCAVLLVRPPASQHRVRDLMTSEVATVTQQTPVSEVISQLIEHG